MADAVVMVAMGPTQKAVPAGAVAQAAQVVPEDTEVREEVAELRSVLWPTHAAAM
jgi:hypothetical protein